MLRIRLVNEVEGPYKIALEQKNEEITSIQETNYDLAKKLQLL
jgi:hypothetical protein